MKAPRIFIWAVMLAASSVAPAIEDATVAELRQARRLAQKGLKTLEAGNLEHARELYERAIERVAYLPEAHAGLGHIAMRQQAFELALEEFRAAEDGYRSMGQAMYREEIRQYTRAQEIIAENRARIRELGKAMANNNNAENARIMSTINKLQLEIQQLERLEPPEDESTRHIPGEIYFFIGNAMANMDRYEAAVRAWETCAQMSPRFPPVYNNLAVAYWHADRLDEAEASLARAEELGVAVNPAFKADLERSRAEKRGMTDQR